MRKILSIIFLFSYIFLFANSEDNDFLKKHGLHELKEDKKWGSSLLQNFLENSWGTGFEKDDLLPEEDKGKEFNQEQVADKEMKGFLGLADKKKKYEGSEILFQSGREIVDNPERSIGIICSESKEIPEEQNLVKCQEAGTYQLAFSQKRMIEVLPRVKTEVKRCNGHAHCTSERFFWKSSAEESLKKAKKQLSKDPTLETFNGNILEGGGVDKYFWVIDWKHKDNTDTCQSYTLEEIFSPPVIGEDSWQTDFPEDLAEIEKKPHCKLLYSQITVGPEMRLINGQSIFRDQWERQLFFSCEPNSQSPCATLRTQGGTLCKKKCLKENRFGECDLWEKTYDLGKKAAFREEHHLFDKDEIFGLTGGFDTSYDKNNELADAVSILSIFSDLQKEPSYSGKKIDKDIEIFRGENMRCQCSFIHGALYDCCKKMEGVAISTYLARCNAEEQALAERRESGQCHFIGSKKENLHTQTSQIFCCFRTKLARILHEQGREQLKINWGSADNPNCRGFSIEELQRIDFSKIDLSDAFEDVCIDKEALLNKVRSTVDHLQSSGATEGEKNTDQIVQAQEKIRNGH